MSPTPNVSEGHAPETLEELIRTRHVLVVVGAGGAGKTTTTAALGVAAAQRGRRVLCLTIDPAKRLAQSLGLEQMTTAEQAISPEIFRNAGLSMRGSLTAMMLDPRATFDELIMKYSSTRERAEKLLNNKLYKYVSTSLAGTQEYMAMEKLVAVRGDARFDLILLDTPPTANALDFLDAPQRLIEALDSATMRWFVQAFESTGKLSMNLLARSAAVILRGIGRITGVGFLQSMAELIAELNDLFGGFKERAKMVEAALRSSEVSFVLVSSPAPMSIQEVLFFSDRLEQARMPRGAFVVNRFRLPAPGSPVPPTELDAARALARRGISLGEDGSARVLLAYRDAQRLAELDALHVRGLYERARGNVPIVSVPELPADVHDLPSLAALADVLVGKSA
ncbi:MAG: AAA family ATPase [Myxococcota bacterium]|nr:AAA family ATPase [Myxococcota bacterium]